MEASLITLAKTPEPESHPPLRFSSQSYQNAVLGLAYVALLLNVGAIMSALKLVDGLGRMNYRNAVKGTEPVPNWPLLGPADLMKTYGFSGSLRLLTWHCKCYSAISAYLFGAELHRPRRLQPPCGRFMRSRSINHIYLAARSSAGYCGCHGGDSCGSHSHIRHGLIIAIYKYI